MTKDELMADHEILKEFTADTAEISMLLVKKKDDPAAEDKLYALGAQPNAKLLGGSTAFWHEAGDWRRPPRSVNGADQSKPRVPVPRLSRSSCAEASCSCCSCLPSFKM